MWKAISRRMNYKIVEKILIFLIHQTTPITLPTTICETNLIVRGKDHKLQLTRILKTIMIIENLNLDLEINYIVRQENIIPQRQTVTTL